MCSMRCRLSRGLSTARVAAYPSSVRRMAASPMACTTYLQPQPVRFDRIPVELLAGHNTSPAGVGPQRIGLEHKPRNESITPSIKNLTHPLRTMPVR